MTNLERWFQDSPDGIDDEQFLHEWRLKYENWIRLDSIARLAEEMKPIKRAQLEKETGISVVAQAAREVLADPQYEKFVQGMVEARTAANYALLERAFAEREYWRRVSKDANVRAEMKMTR